MVPAVASPVKLADKPVGKPAAAPIPVAPVVLWVMFVVRATPSHAFVVVPALAVLLGLTVGLKVFVQVVPK